MIFKVNVKKHVQYVIHFLITIRTCTGAYKDPLIQSNVSNLLYDSLIFMVLNMPLLLPD